MGSTGRGELIRFRAHESHKAAWQDAAQKDGRSLSDWLRWLADLRTAAQAGSGDQSHPTGGSSTA